jgi:chromosome segregation ATPase
MVRLKESNRATGVPPLAADLWGLSTAIKDLESQLKDFIRINRALESDLAKARRQVVDLNQERDAMAAKVRDLAHALATSEHGVHELHRKLDAHQKQKQELEVRVKRLQDQLCAAAG